MRLAVPSTGYAALNAARLFGVLTFASSIPGGVVAFQLAYNFYTLSDAVIGRPIAQASLPALSRNYRDNDIVAFGANLKSAAAVVVFLAVPAGIGLGVLALPIAQAVSAGDMSTPSGIALVSQALAGLSLGSIGAATFVLATHASYAQLNARMPAFLAAARSVAALCLMVVVMNLQVGTSIFWLGAILSGTDILAAGFLMLSLLVRARAIKSLSAATALLRLAVSAIAMAATASASQQALQNSSFPIFAVIIPGVLGLAAYLLMQVLLRSPEVRLLRSGLRSKTRGVL